MPLNIIVKYFIYFLYLLTVMLEANTGVIMMYYCVRKIKLNRFDLGRDWILSFARWHANYNNAHSHILWFVGVGVYAEANITVMDAHTSDVNKASCLRRHMNTLLIYRGHSHFTNKHEYYKIIRG